MADLQLDPEPLLKLHWTQGTSWGFHFTFVKAQLLKARGPSGGPMYPFWDTFVLLTWAVLPHMGSPEGNGPTGPALATGNILGGAAPLSHFGVRGVVCFQAEREYTLSYFRHLAIYLNDNEMLIFVCFIAPGRVPFLPQGPTVQWTPLYCPLAPSLSEGQLLTCEQITAPTTGASGG